MTSSLPGMNCSERRPPGTQPHSGLVWRVQQVRAMLAETYGLTEGFDLCDFKKPSDCSTN